MDNARFSPRIGHIDRMALFDRSYRAFARNRFRFSKACGLAVQAGQVSEKP
jgi:hypothetical protein